MFGYNCKLGNCNIISYSGENYNHWATIDGFFTWSPCIVMVLSYSVIWWYIWSNDKYLKGFGHNTSFKEIIFKRELQTAKAFFVVVLCYLLFGGIPLTLLNHIDPQIQIKYPAISYGFAFLFYLQYSLNIFIYAAKSEQYKKAYYYFFRQVCIVF